MPRPLLAFSAIPWTSAYRRPQHLLRRLARQRKVFYFETPIREVGTAAGLHSSEVMPNLSVMRAHSDEQRPGFHMGQLLEVAEALSGFLAEENISSCDVWTNTPLMQPLLDCLNPRKLIYDLNYGPEVGQQEEMDWNRLEAEVMLAADLVVASSPMVARRWEHSGIRLVSLDGGVDVRHFLQAAGEREIARPRIGFAGTMDHRLDFGLLDQVAQSFPNCELCLVGPMTAGGQMTIPCRENIVYLGAVDYALLPGVLRSWSVALMPYLEGGVEERNDVAKIAEYFAAGLPVVTTSSNLVPLRGGAACIGHKPQGFLEHCERMLWKGAGERERHIREGYEAISDQSWDRGAELLQRALEEQAVFAH